MTPQVRTALVVDSSACLPPALGEAPWVAVVPMTLLVDGRELRDGIDVTVEEFFTRLRQAGPPPRSSSPAPGAYLAAFRAAPAPEIVCLTIPERYSMMQRSAALAVDLLREESPQRTVHIVDAGTAAGGYTLVAEAAAAACAAGCTAAAVVAHVRRVAAGAQVIGALETLRYLVRSGRVPAIAGLGGDLLQVRPVFALTGAEVRRLAVVRGTRRALREVATQLRSLVPPDTAVRLGVFSGASPATTDGLVAAVRGAFGAVPVARLPLTPVIALHTGPGLLGAAAVPDLPPPDPDAPPEGAA